MNIGRPVQKFRSVEAMSEAAPLEHEPDFERFLRHCARYWAMAPRQYPRGVFKFRNLEAARAGRPHHTVRPR